MDRQPSRKSIGTMLNRNPSRTSNDMKLNRDLSRVAIEVTSQKSTARRDTEGDSFSLTKLPSFGNTQYLKKSVQIKEDKSTSPYASKQKVISQKKLKNRYKSTQRFEPSTQLSLDHAGSSKTPKESAFTAANSSVVLPKAIRSPPAVANTALDFRYSDRN